MAQFRKGSKTLEFFKSSAIKRINEPFTVLCYQDDYSFSRNRSMGMSYLNRFIIEEDIQFECNGVVAFSKKTFLFDRFYRKHREILEKCKKTIVHLIITADFGLTHEINIKARDTLTKFLLQLPEDKEIIISRIGSQRLECIQKEQYQRFYKEGGQVNTTIRQYHDTSIPA